MTHNDKEIQGVSDGVTCRIDCRVDALEDSDAALAYYRAFEKVVVARLPGCWTISAREIRRFVAEQ
jgi:hypothetical protein